jgi:hypothetical protein
VLSQKTRVGIGTPDDRRTRAIRGAFLLPLYGGLCEAPSRVAGTYPGSSNLVQSATIVLERDVGGLQALIGVRSMSQSLVVKTYQQPSFSIEVPFTPEGYFNATKAAQAFGTTPKDWLRTQEAQKYIDAVRRKCLTEQNQSVNRKEAVTRNPVTEQDQLVIVKQGGSDQGTWLHPKLGIVFARWLNVDFALWCDEIIDGILHGQQSQPQPHDTPTLSTEQWQVISDLIRDISLYCRRREGASHAAHERIRFAFGLRHSSDLLPQTSRRREPTWKG